MQAPEGETGARAGADGAGAAMQAPAGEAGARCATIDGVGAGGGAPAGGAGAASPERSPARVLTFDDAGEPLPASLAGSGATTAAPPPQPPLPPHLPLQHSPAPPAPTLPLTDALLVLALLAPAAAAAARGAAPLAAAALALPALALLYASLGTAAWLSAAHLRPHATPHAAARTAFRHTRNVGARLPCPYPDGWFAVALSAELPPGALVDAVACGVPLAVFRPAGGGAAPALDAYCAHNGAHLAHGGGRVVGDCVRCPFHGWTFDCKGAAVATGAGGKPPPGSNIRAYPVLERNGVVAVWLSAAEHKKGGAVGEPWFLPPLLPELNEGPAGFTYHGFSEHAVPAHISELPENGADVAHLTQLHGDLIVPALRPWLRHAWAAHWAPHASERHLAELHVEEAVVRKGGGGGGLMKPIRVRVLQAGMSQVYLQFEVPGVGRVVVVETVTPQAPAMQRVLHAVYGGRGVPRVVAKAILWSTVQAYEQDVPVWAHKRFEPAPRLAAEEGAVRVYRGWAKQFMAGGVTFGEAQRAWLRKELGLEDSEAMAW